MHLQAIGFSCWIGRVVGKQEGMLDEVARYANGIGAEFFRVEIINDRILLTWNKQFNKNFPGISP